MIRSLFRSGACITLLIVACTASAAQIEVISTLNIRPALNELVGPFEKATGDKVVLRSQPATPTRLLIERHASGDVVIHSRLVLEALARKGLIRRDAIVNIAHASIAVIVRSGTRTPDVSTNTKLRNVLLHASAVTYPDPAEGSIGGNYLKALFKRWGIASKLQPRLELACGGAAAAHFVAEKVADIGLNQTAELMGVPGVQFVTPLPPALTRVVVMSAAVLPQAHHPRLAAQWIKFLKSPRAAVALRAHGLEP